MAKTDREAASAAKEQDDETKPKKLGQRGPLRATPSEQFRHLLARDQHLHPG